MLQQSQNNRSESVEAMFYHMNSYAEWDALFIWIISFILILIVSILRLNKPKKLHMMSFYGKSYRWEYKNAKKQKFSQQHRNMNATFSKMVNNL